MIDQTIKQILSETIIDVNLDEISFDDDLADYGLNSTRILEVILQLEQRFSIQCTDEDFDFENFRTIRAMMVFVENQIKKLGSSDE